MPKRKIMPGDWFIYSPPGFVFQCAMTAYDVDDTIKDTRGNWYRACDCIRLPASPKDLATLWKLAEKMKEADKRNYDSEVNYYRDKILILMSKSKRKGTK